MSPLMFSSLFIFQSLVLEELILNYYPGRKPYILYWPKTMGKKSNPEPRSAIRKNFLPVPFDILDLFPNERVLPNPAPVVERINWPRIIFGEKPEFQCALQEPIREFFKLKIILPDILLYQNLQYRQIFAIMLSLLNIFFWNLKQLATTIYQEKLRKRTIRFHI